jgi:Dolichyl-phosphate-mannose-protein mannosyltransferase
VAATPSTGSAERDAAPAPPTPLTAPRAWQAWEVVALAAGTLLALLLRAHGMTAAPLFTDNADEIQFTWAGLNLILHGDAYTWSYYPGYASYGTVAAYGTSFPMVHHWMDHPPLFSLVIGGWVWLLGVRDMLAVTPDQVRALPVVFSSLTVPLTHLLARRFVSRPAAMCGALLLATAPAAVLFGREAEPESLQAVLLLAALLLTLRVLEGAGGRWTVAALLVCAVAAPLLKVSGIAIAGICAVVLASGGRWRHALTVGGAGVAGLLLFVAYGALVDWDLFLHIWAVQASNRSGVMSAFDFITSPAGVNRRLRDGWWLLGWVGLGMLVTLGGTRGRRRELLLVWPPVAYAAVMLVMAGEAQTEQYGWYRLIVYPELYLAAGWLAWEAIGRRSLALLTLVLVLGGSTATNWWLGGLGAAWIPNPVLLVALMAAVLAPAILVRWRPDEPVYRHLALGMAVTALALVLLGNAVESFWLDRIFLHS